MNMSLPFMAPLFAFMLAAPPKPPMGLKGLLGLLLVLAIILSAGLILTPVLQEYPTTGLLLVLFGLFAANYIILNLGKGPVGAFMTVGVAMISMIGQVSYELAAALTIELLISIGLAVVVLWVVYPLFLEDDGPVMEPPPPPASQAQPPSPPASSPIPPALPLPSHPTPPIPPATP